MNLRLRYEKFINTDNGFSTEAERVNFIDKFNEEIKDIELLNKEGTYIYYVVIRYLNASIELFNMERIEFVDNFKKRIIDFEYLDTKRNIKLFKERILLS